MVDLSGVTIPEKLNRDDVKRAAAGQWARILQAAGLRPEQCSPKHKGPCPRCGGRDRFRPLNHFAESGGLWCRHCHNNESTPKAGDGFAAVQWLRDCGFSEALDFVAVELGLRPGVRQPSAVASSKQSKLGRIFDSIEAAAAGLRLAGGRQPDRVWHYHDADGNECGAVLRWDLGDGRKEIRPLRFDGSVWVIGAMDEPRPLYRLRDLLAAATGEPIFIVEGEKATDAGASLGLLTITSAGGSNAAEKTDWGPVAGRRVVVIPDHDEPGEAYAAAVVKLATAAGAASVGVLRLPSIWPGCPAAGDLADFSEAHDGQSADSLRDVILGAQVESIAVEDAESLLNGAELFEVIDSAAFATADLSQEFWIQGVLAARQPQLWGGPSKTLKTSLLVDMCLSLAAGVPFMGEFEVPSRKRVLLVSSESGGATLQETALRICAAKGINLAGLRDGLQWGFRAPQLRNIEHLEALKELVRLQSIDVVAIDPAYLSIEMDSAEAANQFAVGAILQKLTELQSETGVLPVLATHFRKLMPTGEVPSLEHIAGAGFGQWARQWFLLNRKEKFNPDSPGIHRLIATWGGSAGHCGGVVVDVDEGRREDGRTWNLNLQALAESERERTEAKQQKDAQKAQEKQEGRRWNILQAMQRLEQKAPDGSTKTEIRQEAGLNPDNFAAPWNELLRADDVREVKFPRGETKKGQPRMVVGFRRTRPEDRLQPTENSEAPEPTKNTENSEEQ